MKSVKLSELQEAVFELLHEEGPMGFDEIEDRLEGVGSHNVGWAVGSLEARGLMVYRVYQGWEAKSTDERTDTEKLASIREIVGEARSQMSTCATTNHPGGRGENCPNCARTGYHAYAKIYKLVP